MFDYLGTMSSIVLDITANAVLCMAILSGFLGILTILVGFGVNLPAWCMLCVSISGFITLMPCIVLFLGAFTTRVETNTDE